MRLDRDLRTLTVSLFQEREIDSPSGARQKGLLKAPCSYRFRGARAGPAPQAGVERAYNQIKGVFWQLAHEQEGRSKSPEHLSGANELIQVELAVRAARGPLLRAHA